MMDDDNAEEPPALSSSRASASAPTTSAPPPTAFLHASGSSGGGGAAPPSAAFAHSSIHSSSSSQGAPPPSDDVNSRWKQYASEMEGRRSESSLSVSRSVNDADEREATRRFMRDSGAGESHPPPPSSQPAVGGGAPYSGGYGGSALPAPSLTAGDPDLAPRRVYSFNKSSSYDTNELIRKYAGVTGIQSGLGGSGSAGGAGSVHVPPPTANPRNGSIRRPSSHSASSVREEALQVLDLVDEHLNTPFSVRRTESGGFRAAPTMSMGSPYRVRRTDSGAVVVENDREDGGDDDADGGAGQQPYFVKRTASGTITSGRGSDTGGAAARRTPSALAGLSLAESASSRSSWRAGRYSFTDPKFREDSYIADEEDDILRTVASRDADDGTLEVVSTRFPYRDSPISPGGSGGFQGDYPQSQSTKPSTWSSRYSSDSPQKRILDRWDDDYSSQQRDRQSARNMFMSTASNMRIAAGNVGETVATQGARVFGAGFSFRQSHTFGHQQQKGGTNLRTVWKDDVGEEESSIQGTRVHKTWQEVMLNKRRRRRVLLSLVCVVLAAVVVGVSVGTTSDDREAKRAANFAGSGLGSTVTFYATSDTPYDRAEEEQLSKDLSQIPRDAEFILHLGNLQDAAVSMCPYSRNYDAASILKKSPVPLFVVPGEQDWVKCPNQAIAWGAWLDAFGSFQSNFDLPFEFSRSENHPEVFAFLQSGVLFFGLHLVSGTVSDVEAHDALNTDLKAFVLGMINLHRDQFRAVVMMGNARPGPQQRAFFDSISDALVRLPAPVAYVHAQSGSGPVEHAPFDDIDVFGIQVPKGGEHPPLKITVGFGLQPFVVG
jgi:hypothetical protein